MRILKDDFRNNNIHERSIVCLDKNFFESGFSMFEPRNGPRDGKALPAAAKGAEEEKK